MWESCLKARNSRYVSLSGLKQHFVSYISSKKSRNVSDILSHIGPNGNRNFMEKIINNSQISLSFQDPKNVTLFIRKALKNALIFTMSWRESNIFKKSKYFGLFECIFWSIIPKKNHFWGESNKITYYSFLMLSLALTIYKL